MTCPPAASIFAAAAITSITMNGGTSLRPEGVSSAFTRSLSIASCIDFCYLGGYRRYRVPEPVTAPDWPHSKACYSRVVIAFSGGVIPVRDKNQNRADPANPATAPSRTIGKRPLMLLRIAFAKTTLKLTALTVAAALAVAPMAALAQEGKGPSFLRDTESEQLLREYTRPILRAAGLEKQNIQMVIINDGQFNAFVADGRRIFVNYGAMMQSQTPNQIIGVLAHETGHLAGGHLSKMREQIAQAQTQMIIAMLLGAGAMLAGSRGGNANSGLANVGAAAVSAPQELIRRTLISYQRQQEENADRAGVKFLTASGQSPKGMYDTFKRFTNDSLFA